LSVSDVSLHALVQPISFLLGTWKGEGKGEYPSIEPFSYGEEVRFWHVGRPWLGYSQRTWNLDNNAPMHSEMGYWRPQEDGSIEVVLAHAFGVVEVQEGTVTGSRVELKSRDLVSTSTAKEVSGLARTFEVDGDRLTYEVAMAYGEHPLQSHLSAELRRTD
jgi:hypothetical protein